MPDSKTKIIPSVLEALDEKRGRKERITRFLDLQNETTSSSENSQLSPKLKGKKSINLKIRIKCEELPNDWPELEIIRALKTHLEEKLKKEKMPETTEELLYKQLLKKLKSLPLYERY